MKNFLKLNFWGKFLLWSFVFLQNGICVDDDHNKGKNFEQRFVQNVQKLIRKSEENLHYERNEKEQIRGKFLKRFIGVSRDLRDLGDLRDLTKKTQYLSSFLNSFDEKTSIKILLDCNYNHYLWENCYFSSERFIFEDFDVFGDIGKDDKRLFVIIFNGRGNKGIHSLLLPSVLKRFSNNPKQIKISSDLSREMCFELDKKYLKNYSREDLNNFLKMINDKEEPKFDLNSFLKMFNSMKEPKNVFDKINTFFDFKDIKSDEMKKVQKAVSHVIFETLDRNLDDFYNNSYHYKDYYHIDFNVEKELDNYLDSALENKSQDRVKYEIERLLDPLKRYLNKQYDYNRNYRNDDYREIKSQYHHYKNLIKNFTFKKRSKKIDAIFSKIDSYLHHSDGGSFVFRHVIENFINQTEGALQSLVREKISFNKGGEASSQKLSVKIPEYAVESDQIFCLRNFQKDSTLIVKNYKNILKNLTEEEFNSFFKSNQDLIFYLFVTNKLYNGDKDSFTQSLIYNRYNPYKEKLISYIKNNQIRVDEKLKKSLDLLTANNSVVRLEPHTDFNKYVYLEFKDVSDQNNYYNQKEKDLRLFKQKNDPIDQDLDIWSVWKVDADEKNNKASCYVRSFSFAFIADVDKGDSSASVSDEVKQFIKNNQRIGLTYITDKKNGIPEFIYAGKGGHSPNEQRYLKESDNIGLAVKKDDSRYKDGKIFFRNVKRIAFFGDGLKAHISYLKEGEDNEKEYKFGLGKDEIKILGNGDTQKYEYFNISIDDNLSRYNPINDAERAAGIDKDGNTRPLGKDHVFGDDKILIGKFYVGHKDFQLDEFKKRVCTEILEKKKGFKWFCTESEDEFLKQIKDENYTMAWVIGYNTGKVKNSFFAEQVIDFYKSGGHLYLWDDDDPEDNTHTPEILKAFYKKGIFDTPLTLTGNNKANQKMSSRDPEAIIKKEPLSFIRGAVNDNPVEILTRGMQNLYEGFTICYPKEDKLPSILNPIAYASNSKPNIMVSLPQKQGRTTSGRMVIDCGCTKLFSTFWDSVGTALYVENATCWLAGEYPSKK